MLITEPVLNIIKSAIKEDVGNSDITTNSLIPTGVNTSAYIFFKEPGVVCGLGICEKIFSLINKDLHIKLNCSDGDYVEKDKAVIYLEGPARAILTGERVALNFLGYLSGIATKTKAYVDKIKPYSTKLVDTRKTTPNLRILEKYAVRMGGGFNHRHGLYDQVLIKDNHLALIKHNLQNKKESYVIKSILAARKKVTKQIKIEVEVENLEHFRDALSANPDIIMLDNMAPEAIKEAVLEKNKHNPRIVLEASGGITLDNISEYAKTGVDMISVGALTHSVKSIDVSLEIIG